LPDREPVEGLPDGDGKVPASIASLWLSKGNGSAQAVRELRSIVI
jgi:hypothetical protein